MFITAYTFNFPQSKIFKLIFCLISWNYFDLKMYSVEWRTGMAETDGAHPSVSSSWTKYTVGHLASLTKWADQSITAGVRSLQAYASLSWCLWSLDAWICKEQNFLPIYIGQWPEEEINLALRDWNHLMVYCCM